jgi:hypothetical protein
MPWVIWDSKRKRPYVNRSWDSHEYAEAELNTLLMPYEPGSYWRRRLGLRERAAHLGKQKCRRRPPGTIRESDTSVARPVHGGISS